MDEARADTLYELEIAFEQPTTVQASEPNEKPWLSTGSCAISSSTSRQHASRRILDRQAVCAGHRTGRSGSSSFAPSSAAHARMSLLQILLALARRPLLEAALSRALVYWSTRLTTSSCCPTSSRRTCATWSTTNTAPASVQVRMFAPFLEFRFPRYGAVAYEGIEIELRQAIEPWHVLGEQVAQTGMSRYVDSSVERLQVKATRLNDARHVITCNGRVVPLASTGRPGEFVAGVRYRAWAPPSALHPTIGIHAPLGSTWSTLEQPLPRRLHLPRHAPRRTQLLHLPVKHSRPRRGAWRASRRWAHTGRAHHPEGGSQPALPMTLDLRKAPESSG